MHAKLFSVAMVTDPSSLQSRHLNRVAKTIVNRAWEDPGYWSTAAKLCSHICQVSVSSQGFVFSWYSYVSAITVILYVSWIFATLAC